MVQQAERPAGARVNKRTRAKSAPASPGQVVVSIGVNPVSLDRWKKAAAAIDRPLSWYLRNRLEEADSRDDEVMARTIEAHEGAGS